MEEYIEKNIRFRFEDGWRVIKYDDEKFYRSGIGTLPDTKAVDFIACRGNDLYFIEVKDFRGHRIENRERLESGQLTVEVGKKVRDSVAGILGAYRHPSHENQLEAFIQALTNCRTALWVILWLEHDLPTHPQTRKKALQSIELNQYKQKLAWLTNKVRVINHESNNLEAQGLSVQFEPHHGS